VAHEKMKKQYEEDCKNYERPWELWEYKRDNYPWRNCGCPGPEWKEYNKYRRKKYPCIYCGAGSMGSHKANCPEALSIQAKEIPFRPEYFSGLNWQEAERFVGKIMEFSDNAVYWDSKAILWELSQGAARRFRSKDGIYFVYCRTCPDTFVDSHPTIRITVNGRDFDLPRPETEAPRDGTKYWAVAPMEPRGIEVSIWLDEAYDNNRLKYQAIHLTEARAQAWADFWKELHKTAE
jgi:hypothetical protein